MQQGNAPSHLAATSPVATRRQFARRVLARAQTQGGMVFVVDGLPGVGKTYLLRELLAAAAAAESWKVMFVRADEIERNEPFSFVERFVASAGEPHWHFVPDADTDPVAIARECVDHLVGSGANGNRIIVLDDAQWIDADSQRVLRYVMPRVSRRNTLLAFGVRTPHQRHSFGEFLTQQVADNPLDLVHHLEPLTAQEVAALVLERHGAGISAQSAQRIAETTNGSFLEVDSVLSAMTRSEIARLHLIWEPPIRLRGGASEQLLHQFEQMSPEAQRTAEIVTLAGHEVTRECIADSAALLDEPARINEAIEAGVLIEAGIGTSIMPRHALLAQAINQTVTPERAQTVHRALAETTAGHRALRHSLLGAQSWSDDLHQRVEEYVQDAADRGNFMNASEVLRAALDLTEDPSDRSNLVASIALIHIQAKNAYLVLDLLEDIRKLPHSILHEFISIFVESHRIDLEVPLDRAQKLLASTPSSPDERTVLAFFAFMAVILTLRSADHSQLPALIGLAKMLTSQAPADPDEVEDPRLRWMVARESQLLVLDSYAMVGHQMRGEMAEVAQALPELIRRVHALPEESLKVDSIVALAGAKLALGELDDGHELAQLGVDLLGTGREPWAASTARVILADCRVLQGQYEDASHLIELTEQISYSSLDVETRCSWAALRVIIAAVTGQNDAESYLEQARRQHLLHWEGYAPDLSVLAECELARSQQDPAGVVSASEGDAVTRLSNTRHGFLTFRANALIDLGWLPDAEAVIEQIASFRGMRWFEYWGSLDWLRARLAFAKGDQQAAQWHFEAAVEQRVPPLPRALTLADYGQFLLESDRRSDGIEQLQKAVGILESIGAGSYLPRIRRTLEQAGSTSSPAARHSMLETLTERELQIVDQLAKGRSNSQIAESLVVSVTTVRSHVSNVLLKLRLTSRGEVAKLMRESMPEGR